MCNGRAAYSSASSHRLPTRLGLTTFAELPVFAKLSSIITDGLTDLLGREFSIQNRQNVKSCLEDYQSSRWIRRTERETGGMDKNCGGTNERRGEGRKAEKMTSFVSLLPSQSKANHEREKARSNPVGIRLCKLSSIIILGARFVVAAITSSRTIIVSTIIGLWCNCSRRLL